MRSGRVQLKQGPWGKVDRPSPGLAEEESWSFRKVGVIKTSWSELGQPCITMSCMPSPRDTFMHRESQHVWGVCMYNSTCMHVLNIPNAPGTFYDTCLQYSTHLAPIFVSAYCCRRPSYAANISDTGVPARLLSAADVCSCFVRLDTCRLARNIMTIHTIHKHCGFCISNEGNAGRG